MSVNTLRRLWHLYIAEYAVRGAAALSLIIFLLGVALVIDGQWWVAVGVFATSVTFLTSASAIFFSSENRPKTTLCLTDAQINSSLCKFIARGTSVHIGSFNLSWIRSDPEAAVFLKEHAAKAKITVFAKSNDALTEELKTAGITVYVYPSGIPEPPRFTLLNFGRAGAEYLAVARGAKPEHWIDEYTWDKHPQIISLARAHIERYTPK